MSRSDKDMPLRIQEEDGRGYDYKRHRTGGGTVGGMYARIVRRARRYWRGVRVAVRADLARGREPEPTRTRSSVRSNYW